MPDLPDQPARVLSVVGLSEYRGVHQLVHRRRRDRGLVMNGDSAVEDGYSLVEWIDEHIVKLVWLGGSRKVNEI